MGPRSSDDPACPVCGQSFDQRIVLSRGASWSDLFAGTPFSFFRRYQRRCTSQYDVLDDTQYRDGDTVLYFHTGHERVSLM